MARLGFEETMERLLRLIQAGYPAIYLVSHEESRVFDCIARIVTRLRQNKTSADKCLFRWSQVGFQQLPEGAPAKPAATWLDTPGARADLLPAKHGILTAAAALEEVLRGQGTFEPTSDCVAVFLDVHPSLAQYQNGLSGDLVRPLRNAAEKLRRYYDAGRGGAVPKYQTIIVVAPTAASLSPELVGDVVVLDFPLPELPELERVLNGMVSRGLLKFPTPIPDEDLKLVPGASDDETFRRRLIELIAGAGRGLTLHAFQQGLNMIQVEQQTIRAKHVDYMMQLKADTISNPALQYTPRVEIKLGGLHGIKEWIRVRSGPAVSSAIRAKYRLPAPKGVMLSGASGGGKSQLAKLIAKEFNLALLRLDVGSLFASYVGESEQRTRQALQLAEILAPVVLWIDEIDKAFAGVAGGGGDNGVSARVFGHFLTWLAEKQDDIFVVVTANRSDVILQTFPEFGRKGRFDEIFWVGLPKEHARREIFNIYLARHLSDHYLDVQPADIVATQSLVPVGAMNPTEPPRDQLLSALVAISDGMTGAEIEAAINEALYAAYDRAHAGSGGSFTPELLVSTVKASRTRALYYGVEASAQLTGEQSKAAGRGWLDVETGSLPAAASGEGVALA